MPACRTDMVWTFQLSAIGTFGMGVRPKRMMRAPHIAPGRRGFSFWNRHGGNPFLDKSRGSAAGVTSHSETGDPGGKQGPEVNRNQVPTQEHCFVRKRGGQRSFLPGRWRVAAGFPGVRGSGGGLFNFSSTANGLSAAACGSGGTSKLAPGARG